MARTKKLTHGSLFTGVGGIDLGFDKCNIETIWQCEVDKKARLVLAKHWPQAVRYTDVCKVDGCTVKPVDIITFGSPCQDLSIAGKREGFQDGTRSNLYFEAVRIIKEMRDATKNQYPKYAIWENVKGAFSSNGGQDFFAAIQALADVGALDVSWRLVNTCHFGPPQRRMRIFVVADFGGERAAKILFKPTRVCWSPTTRRTSKQKTTRSTSKSVKNSSGVNNPILIDRAAFNQGVNAQYTAYISDGPVVPSLVARGPHAVATSVYQYDGYNQKLETDGTYRSLRTKRDWSDFIAVFTEPQHIETVTDDTNQPYVVRRLTPRECERLQGWPDDHTRWGEDDTEVSDNCRYKMIGNGVSAPVAQWLGENICAANKSSHTA